MKKGYVLQDIGPDVQWAIDKIQALVEQGGETATLLTEAERRKLERVVGARYETTEYWEEHSMYIPQAGELIIYSDYRTIYDDDKVKHIPGVKIGSGNAYVADLMFIGGDSSEALAAHIADHVVHTTAAEKARWNNKLNVDDLHEVSNETLVFNRN